MKGKISLLLFLGMISLVNSQHNNKDLKKVFDVDAFEIRIPNSWKEISPSYPFYWVKEYRYKDTTLNSYFNVAQFRIDNIKENNLESIVKKRVKALKKAWYKKFSYSIKKGALENHFVLHTSCRNWKDKKRTLKHTTEFLRRKDELYVFRYSDSTNSLPSFKKDIDQILNSFKIFREVDTVQKIRTYVWPKFQVKFVTKWEISFVKGRNAYQSALFYKRNKEYIAMFSIEPDYFLLKKDVSLIEIESIIIKKDKSLRNHRELKSRVTNNFIELTGVWVYSTNNKRKRIIRYYKKGKSIFKVVYNNHVNYFDTYEKERKLFFGSIKFKESL